MKGLEPVMMLKGKWIGNGQSPQGAYDLESTVEERGRWMLLRHAIKSPETEQITYLSTQVYGFEDNRLTLDYFDTAGAFKFYGSRDGDHLFFDWKSDKVWKKSEYWKESNGDLRFKYQSMEKDPKSTELMLLVFKGTWTPDKGSAA